MRPDRSVSNGRLNTVGNEYAARRALQAQIDDRLIRVRLVPGLGAIHAGELDDDHARGLERAFQMNDLAAGREELDRRDEKLALEWRQCRPGGLHIPLHQLKVGHIVAGNDIRSHGRSPCLWPLGRSIVGRLQDHPSRPDDLAEDVLVVGIRPPRMIVAHQQAAAVFPLTGAFHDEAVVSAHE